MPVGQPAVTFLLLDRGADPVLRPCSNWTVLHCAVRYRRADFMARLLSYPRVLSPVNAWNNVDKTPLHNVYDPEVARELLAHGADPLSTSPMGLLPLREGMERL